MLFFQIYLTELTVKIESDQRIKSLNHFWKSWGKVNIACNSSTSPQVQKKNFNCKNVNFHNEMEKNSVKNGYSLFQSSAFLF